MNNTMAGRTHGGWKQCLGVLAIAGAWLLPVTAVAQDDPFSLEAEEETRTPDPEAVRELTEVRSAVEVGIGSVGDDSFRFGRYTGMDRQGGFAVLGLDVRLREAYDGAGARYWSLTGSDLGLTSRAVRFEQGTQGNYKVFVTYDQLPTFRSDSA